MAADVVTEIVIDRPAEVVAAYTASPANAPAWSDNITSATWETSPPLRTGSRISFTAHFLGRHPACTYEITGFTPYRAARHADSTGTVPHGNHLHLASHS